MKYAWIENHAVRDICPGNPLEMYHDEVAALYSTVIEDDIVQGAIYDGKTWVNPVVTPLVEQKELPPVVPLTITPPEFKMLFTATERVGIAKARKEDPYLDDFYTLLDDPRLSVVVLNSPSMLEAVEYLAMKDYVTTDRAAAISRNEPHK